MDETTLKECTVRLKAGTQTGTGFFVYSNRVLTCAHVVREVGLGGHVQAGDDDKGEVERLDPVLDVALIKVNLSRRIAALGSEFQLDDPTFSFGYPKSAPFGDPISGKVIQLDGIGLLKFKDTPVEPGMSGAPCSICGLRRSAAW
jgi:Trypsin-like peptidase domain